MKKIIKNISIVLVALILLSSCKKEEVNPVKVLSDTTKTQNNMFTYTGSYIQSRNTNSVGDDRSCEGNSTVDGYIITKDSITFIRKTTATGEIQKLMTTSYIPTTVGDTVEVYMSDVKVMSIRKADSPYSLVIRNYYYDPNPQGIIWVDHYLKKL